tara:strand:+ start:65 stop:415 length:351 start_codon:yes stop_codon:yes gene_type:complete
MLIAIGFASCKSSQKAPSETEIDQEIIRQIGSEYLREDQGKLALCFTKPEYVGSEWKTVVVIDTESLKTLYGPERMNATVKWSDEAVIAVKDIAGVIEDKSSKDNSVRYVNIYQNK